MFLLPRSVQRPDSLTTKFSTSAIMVAGLAVMVASSEASPLKLLETILASGGAVKE